MSEFTALLLVTAGLGALDVAPAVATTTATFSNPASITSTAAQHSAFSSSQTNVSASGTPTGTVYPLPVHMSGLPGTVAGISIALHVTHTAPDDLDVLLVSPSGRTVVLMSDSGGYTDFDGTLQFSTGVTTASLPDTSTFAPVYYDATNHVGNDVAGDVWPAPAPVVPNPNASLASLLGDSPNGDWKLFVRDDQDQDGGSVSWSLTVQSGAVPTPAATYPSVLPVAGLTGTVTDVDLTLNGMSWRDINMLDLMLVAPDGRRAIVLSDAGGYSYLTDATLTLDDEASTGLSADDPPTSGRYRPTNFGGGDSFPAPAPDASTAGSALSVFDGANPNGTWRLYLVQDEVESVDGFISAGWSLKITTTGSGSPRITSATPKAGATRVRRSADIRAVASKALRPSSVTGKTVYLTRAGSSRHIAATVSYLTGSHTVLIDPSRRLKASAKYRVVVTTNVRDAAGTRLDQDPTTAGAQQKTWKFRTR